MPKEDVSKENIDISRLVARAIQIKRKKKWVEMVDNKVGELEKEIQRFEYKCRVL